MAYPAVGPTRDVVMHQHILLPTDGSGLSEQAVNYGVALATAVNAKVTGVTVTTPFHILALVEPQMVMLESYTTRMSTVAAQRLDRVKDAAKMRRRACSARASLPGDHRHGSKQRMRFDCDGFTWPAGDVCNRAWQRDRQGAHPQQDPCAPLSLTLSEGILCRILRGERMSYAAIMVYVEPEVQLTRQMSPRGDISADVNSPQGIPKAIDRQIAGALVSGMLELLGDLRKPNSEAHISSGGRHEDRITT
jgi:hypothetical protein